MTRKYFSVCFNLLVYFSSGALASQFFENIPDRKTAATFAGGLFLLTALRAFRMSFVRPYLLWVRYFFIFVFLAEFAFWAWRITDPRPLSDLTIIGIPGHVFHPIMGTLYFISCLILIFSEIRWLIKKDLPSYPS